MVVLGAGLTGLSFAYHFDENTPVFERESEVGGLVRTKEVNGCHFDSAPHLLHFHSDYAEDFVFNTLGLKAKSHDRRARIYCDGKIINYPFELNLHALSETIREDSLKGLDEIDASSRDDTDALKSGSYHDYVLRAFGSGIGKHYLLPYNRKIWATDPAEMNCEWMKWLPTVDIEKIRQTAREPENDEFGYNAHFFYPEEKGIRELPDALGAQLSNVHLNKEVIRVDTRDKRLTFADGEVVYYEQLVSTLPLPALATLSDSDELKELASGLVHTTVCVVNMVVRGTVPDAHWMYFPDPELDFYRISFPKSFFDKATPNDEHILAVEVGSRNHQINVEEVRSRVEEQVLGLDIFGIEEHLFTHCDVLPVAYSIYDFERAARVRQLREMLRAVGVHSIGRYGQWEYSGMEDAILYGKSLADELRSAS